ncbi:hypothetical protein FG05_35197 [Fusarium graminearum]|nr:hypothetical protein FG05_35197 [Fusarium graminearum]
MAATLLLDPKQVASLKDLGSTDKCMKKLLSVLLKSIYIIIMFLYYIQSYRITFLPYTAG